MKLLMLFLIIVLLSIHILFQIGKKLSHGLVSFIRIITAGFSYNPTQFLRLFCAKSIFTETELRFRKNIARAILLVGVHTIAFRVRKLKIIRQDKKHNPERINIRSIIISLIRSTNFRCCIAVRQRNRFGKAVTGLLRYAEVPQLILFQLFRIKYIFQLDIPMQHLLFVRFF